MLGEFGEEGEEEEQNDDGPEEGEVDDNDVTVDADDGNAQDDEEDGNNVIEPPQTIQKEVRRGRLRRNSDQGKNFKKFVVFVPS